MTKQKTQSAKTASRVKASGRRTPLPTLKTKEQQAILDLRNTHLMTEGMLKTRCGLSLYAIRNLCKSGVLEKITHIGEGGKKSTAYALGKTGEKYGIQKMGLKNFYKSTSFEHDLKLTRHYFKLPEQLRETWKTEGDKREERDEREQELYAMLRDTKSQEERDHVEELLDMLHHSSSVDGTYVNEQGIEVSLEIIGQYSDAQIQEKVNFCQVMGVQWNSIR